MKKPKNQKRSARSIKLHVRSDRQGWRMWSRATFGHTEKILRRNHRLWSRLFSKEGRQIDKLAIRESVYEAIA